MFKRSFAALFGLIIAVFASVGAFSWRAPMRAGVELFAGVWKLTCDAVSYGLSLFAPLGSFSVQIQRMRNLVKTKLLQDNHSRKVTKSPTWKLCAST